MLPTVLGSFINSSVKASSLGKGAMWTVERVPFLRIQSAIASERWAPLLSASRQQEEEEENLLESS